MATGSTARRLKAFRPSNWAPADYDEEERQRDKDANVERYAKRAKLGMPLFPEEHIGGK